MTAKRLHEPLDFFFLQLSTFHNWCCQDMLEHGKALSDTVNVSNDTITWKCTTLQAEFETKGKPLLSSSNLLDTKTQTRPNSKKLADSRIYAGEEQHHDKGQKEQWHL